eukprot:281819_1
MQDFEKKKLLFKLQMQTYVNGRSSCEYELAYECANLSQWIYEQQIISIPNPMVKDIVRYEKIDASAHHAILRSHTKNNLDTLFVVFCGTKDLKDIIKDAGANPAKIQDSNRNIISNVHSGIYRAMKDNFWDIHNEIEKYTKTTHKRIKNIIITGHSLGGGMASLYLFEVFKKDITNKAQQNAKNLRLYNDYDLKIITFGSPLVFASHKHAHESYHQQIFSKLNNISHHFVNKTDLVPRLLGSKSWYILALYVAKRFGIKMFPQFNTTTTALSYIPGAEMMMNKGVDSLINYLTDTQGDQMNDILHSYYGVGLFYFMNSDDLLLGSFSDNEYVNLFYKHQFGDNPAQINNNIQITDAEILKNNHSINSYMNTLKKNAIKSHLRSKYTSDSQKKLKKIYNDRFDEMKSLQISLENAVKKLNESMSAVNKSVDGLNKKVGMNEEKILKLKENWTEKENKLSHKINKEVQQLSASINTDAITTNDNKDKIKMNDKSISELNKSLNQTESHLLGKINDNVKKLDEYVKSQRNKINKNEYKIKLTDEKISELQTTLNSKEETLYKKINHEAETINKDVNQNKNNVIDAVTQYHKNEKELKNELNCLENKYKIVTEKAIESMRNKLSDKYTSTEKTLKEQISNVHQQNKKQKDEIDQEIKKLKDELKVMNKIGNLLANTNWWIK